MMKLNLQKTSINILVVDLEIRDDGEYVVQTDRVIPPPSSHNSKS